MNTSKTTKKVTTPKSFRVFDFYVYNNENRFYIQMFGINDKGETASITIDDYLPFFYFKVEEDWNEGQLREFQRKINQSLLGPYDSQSKTFIYRAELVQHKQLYGFNAGKKFKFAKLTFQNTTNFNKVKMQYYKKKGPFWNNKIEIYEANIPPLLRYFHICEISPSGWVQINQKKTRKVSTPSTTCKYEFVCKTAEVIALHDKETPVPYKICSFDIEASSSHGDFPVPVKTYKRLAMNIYDVYNKLLPDTAEQCNKMIKRSVLTAFGYDNMDDIDEVYPQVMPPKEVVLSIADTLLSSALQSIVIDEDTRKIYANNESMKKYCKDNNDDDEEIYDAKAAKRLTNKTTIVDLVMSASYSRDFKITTLDEKLTSLFTNFRLKGDEVTFIGSTFMKYGDKEPYFNHCLVVGSCDEVAGTQIDVCDSEKDLLSKWAELIASEDPDIIIGYNIFGFDYEFMFRRALANDICESFLQLSRICNKPCKTFNNEICIENTKVVLASGEYDLKYYTMEGRLQIDMYTYFRRDFNLASYKLDDVAGLYISDDIKKTECVYDTNGEQTTKLYSKNLTGLHVDDYIHIELCGFTSDYYDNGRKFRVLSIEVEGDFNVISIEGSHTFDKSIKWTMAKDDVTPQDIFRLTRGSSSDRARVAKYCIQDCNLVHHLLNKTDVITGYIEMSRICNVPISFLVFRGQGIKLTSYVAKKCMEKDTLMPDLEKGGESDGYEGAIVLPPKCSMYMDNPVACVDYASLYPSSMISQNYSHDSKVWTKEYDLDNNLVEVTGERDEEGNFIYDNLQEYEYIDIEFDTFKYERKTPTSKADKVKCGTKVCRWAQLPNSEKSIMPAILEELLKARKDTKKLMKSATDPFMENILDKRQLGYKVTANSLYGQCGARTSTFYEQDVAASTTATGRMMIMYAKGMIEDRYGNGTFDTKNGSVLTKAEYVYGDTDSVFFTFNLQDPATKEPIRGKKALEITIELAQDAAHMCTQWLKPPMSLEYEKTLMPFILLSKKRYVGMLYEDDPNKCKLKFMGLSLKRRDSCDYLKDTYGEILNILMKENDVEKSIEFLNKSLEDLVNGEVPMDKLAITKALRSDYKNPERIAHRVLADRIGERDPGNKPKPGDRMKFVYIHNKNPKALLGDRVETPNFIVENGIKIDYTYYVTNQLMKPLQQLYGLALVDMWTHRGKTGAIKTYMKDIDKLEKDYGHDLEDFMKRKEKYCSTKVKTMLFDKILTRISNDKNNMMSLKSYFG
jgi:DNA polymerase elongation subunit (family B)